ncbi:c-type cytochrome biogenesis protein CcmI [Sneathiella chinensis]|uniref:Cytochrome c-type biogenesis protein CycH n=1 Tax=Sneathiella chinensis TaxID=349750 RepID=A0ABQ5U7D7_9PROT|nr:c-type cytochrome biogenesis protein CcmI [Sneathiella chinensis]GLQ07823.1 cytochrome c-type biogenesis protein CycH [Sneathiella chinensis]
MIWVLLLVLTVVALMILIYPLLKKDTEGTARVKGGLTVYKQQLQELEQDVARGILSGTEADQARLEIQRRILKASRESGAGDTLRSARMIGVAIALIVAVPAAALGLYYQLGSPTLKALPLASRDIQAEKQALASQDMGGLVAKLAQKLQEQPDNLDGWILLARSLSRMGRYEEAANTYLQALRIAPDDADLLVGAGENFYFLADGVMSDAAINAFERAYQMSPDHPGARYYMALREAQSGNEEKALQDWIALFEDSEPDAPFMEILRSRIADMGATLDRDVSELLASKGPVDAPAVGAGPTREDMEAAASLSEEDRQDMILSMVERLATRMAEAPEFDGLMRLGQVYSTLKQFENAADAYGRASGMQPDNPGPLVMQAFSLVKAGETAGAVVPEDALALYRKALTLDDDIPEALWYVGVAEAAAGNREEALRHWRKLQSVVPEDSALHGNVEKAINALPQ